MSRTTPEEAFSQARAAMERGDWNSFFACLDPHDVLRIAENSVARFLAGGETTAPIFTALCGEHGVLSSPGTTRTITTAASAC